MEVHHCFCNPGGGRTHDPQIKSLLLYQLSYEVIFYFGQQKY
jgi:hypothetical protein